MKSALRILFWDMSKLCIIECLSESPWTVSELLIHEKTPRNGNNIWISKQLGFNIKTFESFLDMFKHAELIVIPDDVKSPVGSDSKVYRHISRGIKNGQDLLRWELLRESRADWCSVDYYLR